MKSLNDSFQKLKRLWSGGHFLSNQMYLILISVVELDKSTYKIVYIGLLEEYSRDEIIENLIDAIPEAAIVIQNNCIVYSNANAKRIIKDIDGTNIENLLRKGETSEHLH